MALGYIKKLLIGNANQTTVRYHLILVKMDYVKILETANVGKYVEK